VQPSPANNSNYFTYKLGESLKVYFRKIRESLGHFNLTVFRISEPYSNGDRVIDAWVEQTKNSKSQGLPMRIIKLEGPGSEMEKIFNLLRDWRVKTPEGGMRIIRGVIDDIDELP
jgi:hypothetical protein